MARCERRFFTAPIFIRCEFAVGGDFISPPYDQYRPSYGRTVESHPRQCIIVGSINAEDAGFLRDVRTCLRLFVRDISVHR